MNTYDFEIECKVSAESLVDYLTEAKNAEELDAIYREEILPYLPCGEPDDDKEDLLRKEAEEMVCKHIRKYGEGMVNYLHGTHSTEKAIARMAGTLRAWAKEYARVLELA